jgi:hypothetical protein
VGDNIRTPGLCSGIILGGSNGAQMRLMLWCRKAFIFRFGNSGYHDVRRGSSKLGLILDNRQEIE